MKRRVLAMVLGIILLFGVYGCRKIDERDPDDPKITDTQIYRDLQQMVANHRMDAEATKVYEGALATFERDGASTITFDDDGVTAEVRITSVDRYLVCISYDKVDSDVVEYEMYDYGFIKD